MGLFGGGNSKNISNNYDNRIINDYGGATFNEDNSNNGMFAGVGGNVNYTTVDGGAFEIVDNANNNMAALAGEGFALADSLGTSGMQLGYELGVKGLDAGLALGQYGLDFATGAIDTNANLVGQYGDLSALMLDRTLSSSENTFNNAAMLIDAQGNRNINAALSIGEQGFQQLQMGSELALALSSQNQDAALEQQSDNNSALTNGFKSMMQFADSFSRSDGATIAQSQNKNMMILVGGLVIAIFIFKKV